MLIKGIVVVIVLISSICYASDLSSPLVAISLFNDASVDMPRAITLILFMTLLALLPGLLVVMTSFTRTIIVLSMLRQAIGMQETPPNIVLIMLALFLTMLSMASTFDQLDNDVITPLYEQRIDNEQAIRQANVLMKEYMISQTHEQDIAFIMNFSDNKVPTRMEELKLIYLVPAFLLSELRLAFQIGFIIFPPFLLIDIIVSSVLMSMGMMMVPPISIALPIKVLMFVLIDGWSLVTQALLQIGLA